MLPALDQEGGARMYLHIFLHSVGGCNEATLLSTSETGYLTVLTETSTCISNSIVNVTTPFAAQMLRCIIDSKQVSWLQLGNPPFEIPAYAFGPSGPRFHPIPHIGEATEN